MSVKFIGPLTFVGVKKVSTKGLPRSSCHVNHVTCSSHPKRVITIHIYIYILTFFTFPIKLTYTHNTSIRLFLTFAKIIR